MKATKEEAEKQWMQFAHNQYFDVHFKSSDTISQYGLNLINAYKSALRAKYELMILELKQEIHIRKRETTPYDDLEQRVTGIERCINAIDTITPNP